MTTELIQLAETHKGMVGVAVAWVIREIPVVWPKLVSVYPFCSENGGVLGIAKSFFIGKSQPAMPDASAPQQPKFLP